MTKLTRRNLVGAIAAVPVALTAYTALANTVPSDAILDRLIANWRATKAEWDAANEHEDDMNSALFDAREALAAPVEPSPLPGDIQDMTIREIRAASDAPEHVTAWAQYKADKADHEAKLAVLREEMVGAATRAQQAAFERWRTAFEAVVDYEPANTRQLARKFELLAEDCCYENLPEDLILIVLADMRRLAGEA